MTSVATFLGVDGCKDGWIVAHLKRQTVMITVESSFERVLALQSDLIAIDIPIGLDGMRAADYEARRCLKAPRAFSVFPAPSRALIESWKRKVPTYQQAKAINTQAAGKAISYQTHCICEKIAEVDRLMSPKLQQRVIEVHPEISFLGLSGGRPMRHRKKSAEGFRERLALLRNVVPIPLEVNQPPRGAHRDDVLDALVAGWTAQRYSAGAFRTLPDSHHSQVDSNGLRMQIVFPVASSSNAVRA